jgi:AcrR family transcriptional regulator
MNKLNYRIALQSKIMLTEGLIKLMETNDYSLITVTQICQEAKLSRRTFYRLYETKEDILQEHMIFLAKEFMDMVTKAAPKHYTEVAMIYFEFWKQHVDFLNLLKKSNMLEIIHGTAKDIAPVIFQIVMPDVRIDATVLSFSLAYSLGGLNGILIRWIEGGMEMSSDQLKTILEGALRIAMI